MPLALIGVGFLFQMFGVFFHCQLQEQYHVFFAPNRGTLGCRTMRCGRRRGVRKSNLSSFHFGCSKQPGPISGRQEK
jgi:hypothetical protein